MSSKIPIGLWGYRPIEPEETAQGLLLRVAEIQRHAASDRTAAAAGISRSRMAHGFRSELERFAIQVDQDFERIAADSPRRDSHGRLRLRGHAVAEYLHFGLRRLCPVCLEEKWHHRFWWDLEPVSTCPRHGVELVGACRCGARFGWRGGGLVRCSRCGNDEVQYLPRVAADPKVLRSDAYILARFGVGTTDRVPILDALEIPQVFMVLERIGSACEGYSRTWRSAKSLGLPLSVVQARGFEVLADSKLDDILTRIFDGYIAQGGRPEHGFSKCYGWLYQWFNHKRGVKFSPLLAEAIHLHGAARFPVTPKAHLAKIPEDARRRLSLKEAAAKAETSVFAMKNIGLALGLIRTEKRSGSQLSFPVEEVRRIAHDLKGALSQEETQARLGIGLRPMREMMNNGWLTPALKGGGQRHAFVFRPADVEDLLSRIAAGAKIVTEASGGLLEISRLGRGRAATIGGCVRLILDGKLRVREQLEGSIGLKGMFIDERELDAAVKPATGELVPFGAAARLMRLNARGLRLAIDMVMFAGVAPGAKALPAKHVEAFARKFIMMGEIKGRIGGYFPTLKDQIERAGFTPDKKLEKCLNSGYLRAEVEPFLEKLRQGAVSLDMPPPARDAVIEEARRILEDAERPIETKQMLSMLRKKVRLGPSDQDQFFYATMNEERQEFVYLVGAGWWLRGRAFMGRTFPADRDTPSYHDLVDDEIVAIVRQTKCPIMPDDVVASLAKRRIAIASSDPIVYLRRMAIRRPEVVRFHGKGYWDAARPWPPAGYVPTRKKAAA
ncbi:TniQ family protein [Bradyrhizobium diazoefficiens]